MGGGTYVIFGNLNQVMDQLTTNPFRDRRGTVSTPSRDTTTIQGRSWRFYLKGEGGGAQGVRLEVGRVLPGEDLW